MNLVKLRVLCLDDIIEDADLIREYLKSDGLNLEFDIVTDEVKYSEKLRSKEYDIILSDYNLPGFSGIAALLLAKKHCPLVPFICVSGTIGEDLAVELMHLGASDYIIKDKLSKLPIAVNRALKEAMEHRIRLSAERSLIESEARFRDIIMSSNDWVWEIDKEWKYCYSSEKIKKILGYSPEEMIGKTPFDFMTPEEQTSVGSVLTECVRKNGIVKDIENWNIHKSGHLVCLLTNGFPILDSGGNLVGYRGVDKDITERKLAEEEIRKLSRATEQSSVSVVITDLNGNITYVNRAVLSLTGYSLKELIGKNPRIFSTSEKPREDYKVLWDILTSGKEWKGEFHNKKKSGEKYWESASISPILNDKGEMTHFLAVKEDLTERKKLEAELIEAKVRAEASDKLKTAFLNNISHEVRTPLNGILGFGEFVLQPDLKQEEKDAYLQILNESSDRLVNTITNYMDISLIVSGNMKVRSTQFEIIKILDKIYRLFLPKCRAKGLDLNTNYQMGFSPLFMGDEVLMEKSVTHILDNAVKFTSTGSITLGFNIINNTLEIFIKDTGPGIDPHSQTTIYKVFMQGEVSDTKGYDGSGLGLSIARGLVELMGGKVSMESEPGKGSAFYLKFNNKNINEVTPVVQKEGNGILSQTQMPLVLIAEDEESNATLLKVLFSKHSLKCLIAANGQEAVDLCHANPEISMVLMDIKMPVMDGLEATRRIKEFRKQLPIIGFTAYAMTGDKDKALDAGCDDYLTKPVRSEQLLELINRYINK